jgi:hypothetical protein
MPVDIGSIKRNDLVAAAAGGLALIFSFIPGAVTADWTDRAEEESGGVALPDLDSVNLWHGLGVLAALLLLIGVAGIVVTILNVSELQSLPVRWITTGAWALTSLFALIYVFTYDGGAPSGPFEDFVDIGPGVVGYLLVLLCIVATVFSALGAQESGEPLPGRGRSAGPAQPTPPPAA